jgi:hypothetical protein
MERDLDGCMVLVCAVKCKQDGTLEGRRHVKNAAKPVPVALPISAIDLIRKADR